VAIFESPKRPSACRDFDLRTLKRDQEMRDRFIQRRTLGADKFPVAVFAIPLFIPFRPT
jgi:hypothetical protein